MSGDRALAIRQELGIERLGDIMVKSGFFADARSQAQAVVKIIAGAELGFGPIASMNGVAIINGKTALAAMLIGAAIKASERYDYRVITHSNEECAIQFLEHGEKVGMSTFSMADAKAAGLADSANYRKFPRNMLFARALSNGARWYCPDVFTTGVYTPEELGAEVDAEGNVVESLMPEEPEQAHVPTREADVEDADIVRSADDKLWKRWQVLRKKGLDLGVAVDVVQLPIPREQLVLIGTDVSHKISEREAQLAQQEASRTPWERNRALQAEAFARGLKLRELPSSSSLSEVAAQNRFIEDWLSQQPQETTL